MRQRAMRRAPLSLVKAALVLEKRNTVRGTPTFSTREFLLYSRASSRALAPSLADGYGFLPRGQ